MCMKFGPLLLTMKEMVGSSLINPYIPLAACFLLHIPLEINKISSVGSSLQ